MPGPPRAPVFSHTCQGYLQKVDQLKNPSIESILGVQRKASGFTVNLLDHAYFVGPREIIGPKGPTEDPSTCVLLSNYLLQCPPQVPRAGQWVSYRNFADAAPLIGYFSNAVEGALATSFSGRTEALASACSAIGGQPSESELAYEIKFRFQALPRIALLLLYNDADEAFGAQAKVLFQQSADQFLDPECLAMLGHALLTRLRKASTE